MKELQKSMKPFSLINLLIDISGSMQYKDIQEALNVTENIVESYKLYKIYVITYDTCVQKEYEIEKIKDIIDSDFLVEGRGGTIIMPAIERSKELNADITIAITDGYFEDLSSIDKQKFPNEIIWIITKDGYDKNLGKTGHVVHLKKE